MPIFRLTLGPELAEIPPPDFTGYHRLLLENAERRMDELVSATGITAGFTDTVLLSGTPYREILEVFFAIHDPTSRDCQGNDAGPQYRSAIFYHSDAQKSIAEEMIRESDAEGIWPRPIVTEVRPAQTFWIAEGYHQEYFRNNPNQPYCAYIVAPKVRKFREKFTAKAR